MKATFETPVSERDIVLTMTETEGRRLRDILGWIGGGYPIADIQRTSADIYVQLANILGNSPTEEKDNPFEGTPHFKAKGK